MNYNSHRDHKQRFHKGRQGSILVPHAALSGLLFTINPRQDQRAMREAQLYMNGLTEELRAAHARYLANVARSESGGSGDSERVSQAKDEEDGEEQGRREARHATTSSLLAAELAEVMASQGHHRSKKRPRRDGDVEDDEQEAEESDKEEKKRLSVAQQWFASLETYCKGYMLLSVPSVNPSRTCVVCRAGGVAAPAPTEPTETPKAVEERQNDAAVPPDQPHTLPPHSIVINPLVSRVVEKVFADLLGKNASPIFRHCFRLMPAELTCCPTLPEMQQALRSLLATHFPPPPPSSVVQPVQDAGAGAAESSDDALSFDGPIPVAQPKSHGASAAEPKKAKHMFTVALNFNVKNNTNVEAKKAQYQAQLQATIPMNRFIVVAPSRLSQKNLSVDAVLCVNVIHATCTMGVQRLYSERSGYNLHDLSEDRLELSNSVSATKKENERDEL